ncbi:hypothetical protein ABT369_19620 [Dactylosporangium sp. NPDC000244]|uniref:hypothetical protein n=1 Tax=Dactylosporangium sp. NPDC000244 TaxID=3154365 RepID=UPI00332D019B
MTQHPPHHPTNDPANAASGERPLIDLVAGDPPVPITVWRTARTGGDRGASMPARLARRLVAAYSRPADIVVDLTGDHILTTACTAGGRRHHPAWFTDVASLIVGPATTITANGGADAADDETDTDQPVPHHGARPARVTRIDPSDDDTRHAATPAVRGGWFGDDLTDADMPPHDPSPVQPVPDSAGLAGLTSLVVAGWPLDADPATGRVRLAWLLDTGRELLRLGGCLVLVVAGAPGGQVRPEDFSPIVTAAAHAGLGYLQHIVAVAADVSGEHGDAFVYHLDDEELLTLSRAQAADAGQQWTVAHLRVHADLLVFTPTALAAVTRERNRPGRHGGARHG